MGTNEQTTTTTQNKNFSTTRNDQQIKYFSFAKKRNKPTNLNKNNHRKTIFTLTAIFVQFLFPM